MKIMTHFAQGSVAWHNARAGVVTASEADALLTPLFEIRKGENVDKYVSKKVAEQWAGPDPDEEFSSFATEQGQILEAEARGELERRMDMPITEVGFILTDDGRAGASPDGLFDLATGPGLELKCPQQTNHVYWQDLDRVPKDYIVQVHFSLYVTGFTEWIFASYRRAFPPFVINVKRDQRIQDQVAKAMALFTEAFDAKWAREVERNGGKEPAPWQAQPIAGGASSLKELDERESPKPHPPVDMWPHSSRHPAFPASDAGGVQAAVVPRADVRTPQQAEFHLYPEQRKGD